MISIVIVIQIGFAKPKADFIELHAWCEWASYVNVPGSNLEWLFAEEMQTPFDIVRGPS